MYRSDRCRDVDVGLFPRFESNDFDDRLHDQREQQQTRQKVSGDHPVTDGESNSSANIGVRWGKNNRRTGASQAPGKSICVIKGSLPGTGEIKPGTRSDSMKSAPVLLSRYNNPAIEDQRYRWLLSSASFCRATGLSGFMAMSLSSTWIAGQFLSLTS